MQRHLLGQICALLCALTWAYALVLFKRTGERIAPVALNLFKNSIGLALLIATLAIMALLGDGAFDVVRRASARDIGILLLSGVIGIALADTVFFYSLRLIGVGLFSLVDCCYTPLVVLLSWIMLSETPTAPQYVGGALILVGVLFGSGHEPPPNCTRARILAGVLLAVLAIGLMAFGIVWATEVLRRFPLIWATTLRMAAGWALLALLALFGRDWKSHWAPFRPTAIWRLAVPATVLGTYLSLIFWVAGFKYTYAPVAAVLNQTSVIFSSILAAVLLREPFGLRNAAALGLAVLGVVIVQFSEWFVATWGILASALSRA